jgi:hypothetical protein
LQNYILFRVFLFLVRLLSHIMINIQCDREITQRRTCATRICKRCGELATFRWFFFSGNQFIPHCNDKIRESLPILCECVCITSTPKVVNNNFFTSPSNAIMMIAKFTDSDMEVRELRDFKYSGSSTLCETVIFMMWKLVYRVSNTISYITHSEFQLRKKKSLNNSMRNYNSSTYAESEKISYFSFTFSTFWIY